MEWDFNKEDNIQPADSVVRGSHFAFINPLHYRRYLEEEFVEKTSNRIESS